MNAIKTLLAVSILSTAGVASASTIANFNIGITGAIPAVATTIAGTGTGVLDSNGTLTMDVVEHTSGGLTVDLTSHDVLSGAWDGTTLTVTSGTTNFSSCVGSPLCGAIVLNTTNNDTTASGSFTAAGGSASISATLAGQTGNITYTATPAVPVPAAVWLFGSGLSGLAGIARRRRNAAIEA